MIFEIYDGEELVNLIICDSKELAEQLTGLTAREVNPDVGNTNAQ